MCRVSCVPVRFGECFTSSGTSTNPLWPLPTKGVTATARGVSVALVMSGAKNNVRVNLLGGAVDACAGDGCLSFVLFLYSGGDFDVLRC